MWRFLLLLGLCGSAQAADQNIEPTVEKAEVPKPEPVKPAEVWDAASGAFVSLSEAVKRARGRLVLDQVPTVRDRVMQADGIKVIEARELLLLRQRQAAILQAERAIVERYRGL
jgi:hypothetical protein